MRYPSCRQTKLCMCWTPTREKVKKKKEKRKKKKKEKKKAQYSTVWRDFLGQPHDTTTVVMIPAEYTVTEMNNL